MRQLRYGLSACLLVLGCLWLAGCSSGTASNGWPKVLRVAYAPQAEQLQSGALRTELMVKYLQSQLHMPVEVVRVEGYGPTIEAMRADKVDLATFGALGYIVAAQKANAQAIVARGFAPDKLGGYRSVIAVPRNIPSMQALKTHEKDLVFAFADPASTSGDLYPRVGLLEAGISPDEDFKKVVYAGNHLAAVMTVKTGKVDAGAFMQTMVTRLVSLHKMTPDDIHVLWTSDLIPNTCYAVRGQLPDKLKKEIQTALLQIPQKDPELWQHLSSLFRTPVSGNTYVAVDDASYNGLRKYASRVKNFNFIDK